MSDETTIKNDKFLQSFWSAIFPETEWFDPLTPDFHKKVIHT